MALKHIQVTDTSAAVGLVMKEEEDDEKKQKEVMQFLPVHSTTRRRHRS